MNQTIGRPVRPARTPGGAEVFERRLNTLALSGDGWSAVLRAIAQHTGRPVRLIGVHGGVLAATDDGATAMTPVGVARVFAEDGVVPVTCETGWHASARAVRAGERRVGVLLLGGARSPADPDDEVVLRAASTAVAIEAIRRDAVAAATTETGGRLIDELRYGALRNHTEVVRTAARFGLRLDQPHAAVVFAYAGPNQRTWSTALSWLEMPVRQEGRFGLAVLAGHMDREITRIRVRLQGMVGEFPVLAAAGPVVSDVRETARSFRDAETVLGLLRRRPGEVELRFASLGLAQLLFGVSPERLQAFVEQHLGPILEREEWVHTLSAWLATKGSRAAVAELLHLHRNSVGYRVGQIRELLDADPLDPEVTLRLQAALTARELLSVLREDGTRRPV
ncbi:helix-turn-helix domain-containing protein [Streptomyces uncialis]|uniref:PucR family transcriptional regulator n=1 Tax=Streptomyces uncialis TaxID=1048205 RepID=UPI002E300E11|nr:helix-turn-helix domain-containing protein [Streptomyces uncialis]